VEREFNDRVVRRQLRRLRRKGPDRVTRLLIDALRRASAGRHRDGLLLDVGGGVGAIPSAMVKKDVARAVLIDASPASLSAAREEANRSGMAAQVELRQGDFVELADGVPTADIVTLNRVICCYPDMPKLVGLSASRAQELYGAVYPRETWWTRVALGAVNALLRARRSDFRVFLHPPTEIQRKLGEAGFGQVDQRLTPFWIIAVYQRESGMVASVA
jgi:magnesium-protoporphyrin O-methyltransferase